MVKTLINLLRWNQKGDGLETWNASSGTQVLPNLFKWPTWVDLLRQGQIWSFLLLYGEKGKTMDFSETIVVCDIKLVDAVNQMSKWSFKNIKGQVVHWTSSKVIQIKHFQNSFP